MQDLSGSWCIKATRESTLVMDSPVPLMHHDPERSWITDPDPDHSKGTHLERSQNFNSIHGDIVGRNMFREFGHPVATCCDMLGVLGLILDLIF